MSGESEDSDHYSEEPTDDSVSHRPHHDVSDWPCDFCSDDTSPPSKRPRVDRPDRLSALPESIILHILSLLPTLDSIRTRVLSRRWQYLWTLVPTLHFMYPDTNRSQEAYDDEREVTVSPDPFVDFVNFVDKTLVLCDGSVKNFGVNFGYQERFASSCHLWTRFASRNGVEKFELVFHRGAGIADDDDDYDDDDVYVLPQFLYTNSEFKELHFSLCRVEPKTTVSWNSLKKLSIGYVSLSDDVIQRILAGTPVLETLELYHFAGIQHLRIGNACLKKLILREYWSRFYRREIKISAPSVESLEMSGSFRIFQLVDIKSLVEANLSDLCLDQSSDGDLVNKAQCLLDSLAHVETLTLGTCAILGLAMLHTKRLSPRLLRCKCLTLDTRLWKLRPLVIAFLLRYFPLLQTLTLIVTYSAYRNNQVFSAPLRMVEEEFLASPTLFTGFTLLRTVKFVGLMDEYHKPDLQFAEIVLKNARVLQKMIIHTGTRNRCYRDPNELFKAAQKLLSFPRSSPDAQLLVHK